MTTNWLTTTEAAELLDIDTSAVRRLCYHPENPLNAQRFGKMWQIDRTALEQYAQRPTRRQGRGRPRKEEEIMSYKTRFFDGELLTVLNARLEDAGYEPASADYGSNLSGQYQGEIDKILRDVSQMNRVEIQQEASRLSAFTGE